MHSNVCFVMIISQYAFVKLLFRITVCDEEFNLCVKSETRSYLHRKRLRMSSAAAAVAAESMDNGGLPRRRGDR